MSSLVSDVLVVAACLLAIPVFVFVLEIVAALILPTREPTLPSDIRRQPVGILVPAHNESAGIGSTLNNIKAQLLASDRLLVVADNCSDDTAAVAAAAGVEVIIRNDPARMGKGYALDFGIKYLRLDPPTTLIIIDADCKIAEGTIDRLAATCEMTRRPVQALDLMMSPDESPIKFHVAEFAWRVKNWLRPSGLSALNLPCQLMGTGMAFPWELIRLLKLADGSIVEDIKLGLDLAQAGSPALFCPSAKVTSQFPWSIEGARSQRQRWEEGHVRMILATVPQLLCSAIMQRNFGLFALTLDLLVPPLSLLVMMVTGMFFVAALAAIFGCAPTALFISAACLVALVAAVFLAWANCGRDILPLRSLFSIAAYVFAKLPLYGRLLSRRSAPQWIRTDRGDTPAKHPPVDT